MWLGWVYMCACVWCVCVVCSVSVPSGYSFSLRTESSHRDTIADLFVWSSNQDLNATDNEDDSVFTSTIPLFLDLFPRVSLSVSRWKARVNRSGSSAGQALTIRLYNRPVQQRLFTKDCTPKTVQQRLHECSSYVITSKTNIDPW